MTRTLAYLIPLNTQTYLFPYSRRMSDINNERLPEEFTPTARPPLVQSPSTRLRHSPSAGDMGAILRRTMEGEGDDVEDLSSLMSRFGLGRPGSNAPVRPAGLRRLETV